MPGAVINASWGLPHKGYKNGQEGQRESPHWKSSMGLARTVQVSEMLNLEEFQRPICDSQR